MHPFLITTIRLLKSNPTKKLIRSFLFIHKLRQTDSKIRSWRNKSEQYHLICPTRNGETKLHDLFLLDEISRSHFHQLCNGYLIVGELDYSITYSIFCFLSGFYFTFQYTGNKRHDVNITIGCMKIIGGASGSTIVLNIYIRYS